MMLIYFQMVILEQATTLTNNSTFNSLNNLYLNAHTIHNNALIFADKVSISRQIF